MLYVYALQDPNTFEIRYIGQTNNPLRRRINHVYGKGHSITLRKWLSELRTQELVPIFAILAEVKTAYDADLKEQQWIALCRENGLTLLNVHNGGYAPRQVPRRHRVAEDRRIFQFRLRADLYEDIYQEVLRRRANGLGATFNSVGCEWLEIGRRLAKRETRHGD